MPTPSFESVLNRLLGDPKLLDQFSKGGKDTEQALHTLGFSASDVPTIMKQLYQINWSAISAAIGAMPHAAWLDPYLDTTIKPLN
jgi:hypothetical protein